MKKSAVKHRPQLDTNPPTWAKRLSKEMERAFPAGKMPERFHIRKGVYRFQTFEEADRWWNSVILDSLRTEEENLSHKKRR
jgi:hypothetical protein